MAYKRTSHCSYCHQAGHNRSSCPAYKQEIESLRATYGDNHYQVRVYDERKARRARASKSRSCSFCGSKDHNRRSCPKLKNEMETYRARNAVYRTKYLQNMIIHGWGPGALVRHIMWSGDPGAIYMVTSVDWANVHFHDRNDPVLRLRRIQDLNGGPDWYDRSIALPRVIDGKLDIRSHTIMTPASESSIKRAMPAGFVNGLLGLKDVFKDKKGRFYTIKDGEIPYHYWPEKSVNQF